MNNRPDIDAQSNRRAKRTAHFFDRDGVVNRRIVDGYVRSLEEFEMLPGVDVALMQTRALGRLSILVTNQRGIARGLMSISDLEQIHRVMQAELIARIGFGFDGIYYCPHGTDDACSCRKPQPGMLIDAATDHHVDLRSSWMIGDSPSDIEAGRRAGCRTVRIDPRGESEGKGGLTARSIDAAVAVIRNVESSRTRGPDQRT